MAEQMLMKEGLNAAAAERVAKAFTCVYPEFKHQNFINNIVKRLDTLELKQRVDLFIEVLAAHLPSDFLTCHDLLISLKPYWDKGNPADPLRSFAAWPVTDFIAKHGIDHPELAFNAMYHLTELFSAEFAIRPFIQQYPDYALEQLTKWSTDSNQHVRRLVSEGTRPRLPWGIRLQEFCDDPTPNIPLLNTLKNDSAEYVRRSVANHLNDIAKDNPDTVITLCKQWKKNATSEIQWVIKHACRSLIKSGNPDVFPLLGFTENTKLAISDINVTERTIKLGDSLSFDITINSKTDKKQRLAVDFVIHHVKANGQLTPKVFKLKELLLNGNEVITLSKKHAIKAITTRKYYAGRHKLGIQINGQPVALTDFELTIE